VAPNVSPVIGIASTSDVKRTPGGRPVSIADRLSHLNDAQSGWKAKVQDKDSKQFTVEGKMGHSKESCFVIQYCIIQADNFNCLRSFLFTDNLC